MQQEEFSEFLNDFHREIKELTDTNGSDYRGEDPDHFAKFIRPGQVTGLRPEQIWAVYAGQHWDSIMRFCRDGKVQSESIKSRLLDLAAYCAILAARIKEGEIPVEQRIKELRDKAMGAE